MEERKVPKLRFKEFEDEWEEKKLKEISILITKGTTPKKFSSKGINFIKIESILGNNIDNYKCLYVDINTNNIELKRSILKENDILFAIAGATIGKVAIVKKENLPANTNQALSIIRLNNNINNIFILHILDSNIMKKYIKLNISIGAQPNLNLEQVSNFNFKIPSLEEQTKIANFLSDVDKIIEEQELKVKDIELYKKGMMQRIFKQEIRFKDDNGQDYPEWEEKKLGEIGCFYRGFSYNSNDVSNNGLLVLRSNNIQDNKINYESLQFVSKACKKNLILKDKDILICMANGSKKLVGKNAEYISNYKYNNVTAGAFCSIFRSENILAKYILQTNKYSQYLSVLLAGTNINNLKNTDIENLKFDIPCLEEQTKIANFLSILDSKIEQEKGKLDDLKLLKKGLLQQMFV